MEPLPGVAAYAAVFDRATGARLAAAERFVRSLPGLFPDVLAACDLAYRSQAAVLVAVLRLDAERIGPEDRARLEYWCARAGVRCSALDPLPQKQRETFFQNLTRCELLRREVPPADLVATADAFFTEAGAPPDRARPEEPLELAMDVGGPGWTGVRFDAAGRALFVPGELAPPRGDELTLSLRFQGADRPLTTRARVIAALGAVDAVRGGAPSGFTLELLEPPPELLARLSGEAAEGHEPEQRAHQRYAVNAPVSISLAGDEAPPAEEVGPESAPFPAARIEYASDQELAADFLQNLSQGGAYVRTSRPSPVGTRLALSLRLPGGDELKAPAVVVSLNENGMGVKFELPPEGQQRLAAAIARISARPRRALVVDDDQLVRQMLADALQARGFEVLTAADGANGLEVVMEELLALDLLITDVRMPNMDGHAFIRTIRSAGGEQDLAIVVVTGNPAPGMETRLEREGADAVLDKELGPELIAQAADAVLERKRQARSN